MRCAEARKGKEMKAEERRLVRRRSMYAAALLCVFCIFGALARHKWWRGCYRLLLLDLVRPLLVVRLNRLATGPNTSPPQASASILLCLVEELLRADASREYSTSTKGPLHSVLAAVHSCYLSRAAVRDGALWQPQPRFGLQAKARQSRT